MGKNNLFLYGMGIYDLVGAVGSNRFDNHSSVDIQELLVNNSSYKLNTKMEYENNSISPYPQSDEMSVKNPFSYCSEIYELAVESTTSRRSTYDEEIFINYKGITESKLKDLTEEIFFDESKEKLISFAEKYGIDLSGLDVEETIYL